MKLSKVIEELQSILKVKGDIEVQLQNAPKEGEQVVGYESFFIVPEEYLDADGGWVVNLRSWPY